MSAKEHYDKDLYAVLGVAKTESDDAIRKAYRKLAKSLHPDRNPDNKKAEARFKEVSEAYDILGNPDARKEYDEAREMFANGGPRSFHFEQGAGGGYGGAGASAGFGGFDFSDLFGGAFGGGRAQTRNRPRRGDDVSASITISFEESFNGREASIAIPGAGLCEVCSGSGAAPGTPVKTCPTCDGHGQVLVDEGGFTTTQPCETCRGRGRLVETPCPTCHGSGQAERRQRIRIPAGVSDGQRLRVRGKGLPGSRGGPAGDLEVTVRVRPHEIFGRDGANLTLAVPVTFPEAVFGATLTVPTMDGPVTIKVPHGSPSGKRLRVRDRGMPTKSGRGDLIVTVEIAVPKTLDEKATEALKTYVEAAVATEDPRARLAPLLQERS